MSEPSWYYLVADQQNGPVDVETLEGLIRARSVPAGALVWRDGMAGWQAWETVPELAARVAPSAAVPAPPAFPVQPQFPPAPAPAPAAYAGAGGMRYPKAPLGARFLASIIDGLIFGGPMIVVLIAMIAVLPEGHDNAVGAVVTVGLLILFLIGAMIYAFIKDGLRGGQSLGKRAMKLMVVHLPSNLPCTKGQSAIRYLVMFGLNLVPYVGGLVEPIVVLADGEGRRIGDRAASTQVIAVAAYRSTDSLRSVFS